MTAALELPQLSGGRKRAAALVAESGLPEDLHGLVITVDCRQLRAGTESFADEFVRIVLVDRGAERLQADNVSGAFAGYLKAAGETHAVSERLQINNA